MVMRKTLNVQFLKIAADFEEKHEEEHYEWWGQMNNVDHLPFVFSPMCIAF